MAEILAKYRALAPWVGMIGALLINLLAAAYWSGVLNQRLLDLDRRMAKVEVSDHEQAKWIERIASMEANVSRILDMVQDRRGK